MTASRGKIRELRGKPEKVVVDEFALTHDLSTGDVQQMLDLGILQMVGGSCGSELRFRDGLDRAGTVRAFRAVLRCGGVEPWYKRKGWATGCLGGQLVGPR